MLSFWELFPIVLWSRSVILCIFLRVSPSFIQTHTHPHIHLYIYFSFHISHSILVHKIDERSDLLSVEERSNRLALLGMSLDTLASILEQQKNLDVRIVLALRTGNRNWIYSYMSIMKAVEANRKKK